MFDMQRRASSAITKYWLSSATSPSRFHVFPVREISDSRDTTPLSQLLGWCKDLLRSGAVGIFPKGRDVEAELTQAAKSWKVEFEQRPSLTDRDGRIVIVRSLQPRSTP